ncbi:MAG: hypothetical protein VX464_11690 [Pseudomonadota bacterium]|nr:hypothetical protein [Pseudomonadota bacterium]
MVAMLQERPCYVEFEFRGIKNNDASIKAGHAVYEDRIFAIITPAGGSLVVEKEAEVWISELHKRGDSNVMYYERALQAFKDNAEAPIEGTRIEDWPSLTPAQVKQIKAADVRTVEDLAQANEISINRIGIGARALQQKARAWLESADGQGKASEELAALRTRVADQQDTIENLQAKIARLEASISDEAKSKRGRAARG